MADPQSRDKEGTPKMTTRGQSCLQERAFYITARRSKLRLLTTKSNQIERLMENDENLIHIEQTELKRYKKLYEEFIELNQEVNRYLKEESEAD